jgi:uncharacterized RDD family membrane protein YckC
MPTEPGTNAPAQGPITPPTNPLDEMWYVQQGGAQALGPYRGHDIKAMIERGSIGAQTWVAKVGAPQWSALADVPAFAGVGALRGLPPRPIGPSGVPHGAITNAERPLHYAGFWIRVLAYLVDQLIIFVAVMMVSFVIGIFFGLAAGGRLGSDAQAILTGLVFIAELIIIVTYQMVSLSSRWQATPGKRVCGIHVIRTDGRKIGPGLAIGRYLGMLLSAMILYVGLIMVAFTNQKKGLHDIICSTRVIYGKAEDDGQIAEIFT